MLHWLNRMATLTALAAVVAAVALSGAVLAGSRMGYQAFLMTTGSMRPGISPGDVVVLRAVDPGAVRVGDVITFREPVGSHALVTHRVVAVTDTPDGPVFRTRGDANRVADIWTVHYQGPAWLAVGTVPGVGRVLAFAQTPPGRLAVMALVFVLALGLLAPAGRPAPGASPTGAAA